ncbi:MAG: hypothetical protein Q4E50_01340 [Tissierellia bacterium]|nr:hypothetical protein [Tissierellia bacterium]
MAKLLNLEWQKSLSFRRAAILLIIISFLFALIPLYSGILAEITNFSLLAMIIAILILAVIGSILYFKDDLDQKAPFNFIAPVKTRDIVLSKLVIFITNILIIYLVGSIFLTIYIALASINYNTSDILGGLVGLEKFDLQTIFIFLISTFVALLELFVYGSIAYLAMALVRVRNRTVGVLKWLSIGVLISMALFAINNILFKLFPYVIYLNDLQILDVREISQVGNLENFINPKFFSAPLSPFIGSQILVNRTLFLDLANVSEKHSFLIILPLVFSSIRLYINLMISIRLLDRKIDF